MLAKWHRATIGFKRVLRRQILQLSAGVNIAHFQAVLGPQMFARTISARREHVFVNKYSYIQAITDLDGSVTAFSVTTRKSNFNPILVLGPFSITGEVLQIRLGKTKFAEIESFAKPGGIVSSLGARRIHYYEDYYFGNPGNYQTFIFGINDAGYLDHGHPPTPYQPALSVKDAEVKEFRERSVINTYTITAPLLSAKDAGGGFWFGPDYDQVRIVEGVSKRIGKRELRRLRRIVEMGPYEYFKKIPRSGMRW